MTPCRTSHRVGTVSIRDAIDGLLHPEDANSGPGQGAHDALSQAGHEDLPPELFGTALGHYADVAPIETADALAPIVTRTSPIPLEETDLPPAEDIGLGTDSIAGDAYGLFDAVAPQPEEFPEMDTVDDAVDDAVENTIDGSDAAVEGDPDGGADGPFHGFGDDESAGDSDLDFDDLGSGDALNPTDPAGNADTGGFGTGETAPAEVVDTTLDLAEEVVTGELDDLAPGGSDAMLEPAVETALDDGLGDVEFEGGTDLFSVDFHDADDTDDPDPDDLDFLDA